MGTAEAHESALRALRDRDLSTAELERRLAKRGFSEHEREEVVAKLQGVGLLDDRRFAEARTAALAGRGAGDAFIRHDLEEMGVAVELVDEALDSLEPEAERARRIVVRRGADAKTARYLRGKGFAQETIAALVARDGHDE